MDMVKALDQPTSISDPTFKFFGYDADRITNKSNKECTIINKIKLVRKDAK